MTQSAYNALYDEMVTDPANEISQLLEFGAAARAMIHARGIDPDRLLESMRENAYEDAKDALRPLFYARCNELGIKL
jgi:hypothetical protein